MSFPFASGASKSSRTFTARFAGICAGCDEEFEAGSEVMYEEDQIVHADPSECIRIAQENAPCPECFLVHAGDCF